MKAATSLKKRLSKKQKGFARDYAIDGNGTKAALNNYDIEGKDPEKIASVIAVENLGKLGVIQEIEKQQETLKSALEKQGITPERIAVKIDELLENEDPNAIDKGLKHATNIYGVSDDKPKEKSNNNYTFIFNAETQKEIKEIEARIKDKLLNHATEN